MLFENEKTRIEDFNPAQCAIEDNKTVRFEKDDVPMGCSSGCWSTCVGEHI